MGLGAVGMAELAMDTPIKHCASIVRRAGSNFAPAFRYLDPAQRRGMQAVYAFCRVVDDIVDAPGDAATKQDRLAHWRGEIAACETGRSRDVLTQELGWAVRQFGIPCRYIAELIDGVARDVTRPPIATADDLLAYCYGVAGTVGLISLRIFRLEETPEARAAALALANAFQLTNILRDLHEDAAMGRCYLPQEDLIRFGVVADDLTNRGGTAQVARLIAFEGERAERFFAAAWHGFNGATADQLRPARVMSAFYYALLRRIRRDPLRVLRERVRVPWWQKLQLLLTR